MADREWFTVEYESGGTPGSAAGHWPNRETAAELARAEAEKTDRPIVVVKYTRREIRTFQRQISVDEAEIPTGPAPTT